MKRTAVKIEGMSCGHCVGAVTRALDGVEGVEVERVEIGSATLRRDPERAAPEAIAGALEAEGFAVREQEDVQ